MGMFSSCAKEAEVKYIMEWVNKHKLYDDCGNPYIDYNELMIFLDAEYKGAEWN